MTIEHILGKRVEMYWAGSRVSKRWKSATVAAHEQHGKFWLRAPPWLNGSTSTMQDRRSWVQFPWVTSTFNVDIARILVFYLAMVRNCCGLLWQRSGGCSYLPYTMSAKAVRWVPLDRDQCTLYKINKSMLMFMFRKGRSFSWTRERPSIW